VAAAAALIVVVIALSIASPYFLTANNLFNVCVQIAVIAIIAVGQTMVIITAGIDLSVGSVAGLSGVMGTMAMSSWGMPIVLGILVGVLIGALAGAVNGLLITQMKLPPFIATLGMLYVTLGLAQVLSDVRPIYFEATQPGFQAFFMNKSVVGIPNIVWVMLGAAAIAWILLNKTNFGRYTFALGSNEEAARLSGVIVDRWKITVYAVEGLFVGLAGIIIASRMNSAQPGLGVGYELDAIAAAVIGGTSLSGGEGSIVGTVIGAFLISTLRIGLSVAGVPDQWKSVITGMVVIGAVWLDILRRRAQA
jgi:ribose transport system permease protein